MTRGIRNVIVMIVVGAAVVTAARSPAAEIVVRADTALEVNGQSIIPAGLFGVTAYEGASAACDVKLKETLLNSGIRWAGLPAHLSWMFPKEAPPDFTYGWADTAAAAPFLDRDQGGYQIPDCVKAWRDLGVEPMLYLLGYPEWLDGGKSADGKVHISDYPRDVEQAALAWAEYVALIRRADPGLTWLHLGNEPNARWFKLGKGGSDYATVFKAAATMIKKRNPGVKIGGPVPCWPPSFPPAQKGCPSWYTWDSWAKPLIETAGDELDFFDFHLYEATSPTLALEEVQTTANAMWLKTGMRKPLMITEYGVYLTDEDMRSAERVWKRRVAPWQAQVMDFLDFQPDKVLSLQPHDLFALAGGNFKFIKSADADDQFSLYKMYRVWSALSGRRMMATSTDLAVRAFVTSSVSLLTGKARLAMVVVNTSDVPQKVSVRLDGGLAADPSVPVRCSYVRLVDYAGSGEDAQDATAAKAEGVQNADMGGAVGGVDGAAVTQAADDKNDAVAGKAVQASNDHSRVESGTIVSDRPLSTFTLAPRETRSLVFALSKPVEPALTRWTRDVFGDVIHKDFEEVGNSIEVQFELSGAATGADKAAVRVGLLGSRKGDQVTMAIGGAEYQLGQDWFQCVPLATVPSDGKMKAVFTLTARGEPEVRPLKLRFGSATIALEGTSEFKLNASPAALTDAPARAQWSLAAMKSIPSLMENPWSSLTQSVSNAHLDKYLVCKGVPNSTTLKAVVDGGVRRSACESLTFRVPVDGVYKLVVAGKLLSRSSPTAGNALVSLYILGCGDSGLREIKAFPLNTPHGHGGYPQDFAWDAVVPLQAGWRFAVGLQTVSPGPGNAGASQLEVTSFDVKELDMAR